MKLFMMPQTVPNSPTNGAVAPMVASTPVPLFMSRPAATSSRDQARGDALLDAALVGEVGGQAQLEHGRIDQRRQDAARASQARVAHRRASARSPIAAKALRSRRVADHQLEVLGEPHRPRHQRGEHQADHDPLHEDVGRQEHRPGREIARQVRAADRRGRTGRPTARRRGWLGRRRLLEGGVAGWRRSGGCARRRSVAAGRRDRGCVREGIARRRGHRTGAAGCSCAGGADLVSCARARVCAKARQVSASSASATIPDRRTRPARCLQAQALASCIVVLMIPLGPAPRGTASPCRSLATGLLTCSLRGTQSPIG